MALRPSPEDSLGAPRAIPPDRSLCWCPGCAAAARYLAATVPQARPVSEQPWFRRAEARGAIAQEETHGP